MCCQLDHVSSRGASGVTCVIIVPVLTMFSVTQRYCERGYGNRASMGFSSTPVFGRRCGLSLQKKARGRCMEDSALTSCASYRMRRSCTQYTKACSAGVKAPPPASFAGSGTPRLRHHLDLLLHIVANSFLTSSTPLHVYCLLTMLSLLSPHTCTVARTHRYPQYLHHSDICQ